MGSKGATTIGEYIAAAPVEGRGQLEKIYKLLKNVAPEAEEVIKWGMPFFIEPRFLFAFSAHKAHLSFAPVEGAMEEFAEELKAHSTTKKLVKVAYRDELPEDLIRRMAEWCVRSVEEREDEGFW